MPGGHFIRHLNQGIRTYELTNATVFNFVDSSFLFIDEDDINRQHTTTDKDEFVLHLTTSYSDRPPAQTVPFFLEVMDGKVISVTEEFAFTI